MKKLFLFTAILAFHVFSHAQEIPVCKMNIPDANCGKAATVNDIIAMMPGDTYRCSVDFHECQGSGYALERWRLMVLVPYKNFDNQWIRSDELESRLIDLQGLDLDLSSIGAVKTSSGFYAPGIMPSSAEFIIEVHRKESTRKRVKSLDVRIDTSGNMILAP